jgi:nicotinamide mononucleotide transporter
MGMIEIIGAATGLLYVFLSIRRNILLWLIGIISSPIYFIVFLNSKLYATMILQVYYFGMSIYGLYYWKYGEKQNQKTNKQVVIKYISLKLIFIYLLISLLLVFPIFWLLKQFTDSPYPVCDSVTTTLCIIAAWMLARKYVENWIVWIFSDTLAAGLYFFMRLYATAGLFIAYIILAFIGYYEWKKELNLQN